MKTLKTTFMLLAMIVTAIIFTACTNGNTNYTTNNSVDDTDEMIEQDISNSSDTWTGASSIDELKQKLDGTYWHMNERGMMRKFHFSNGSVTQYTGLAYRGQWEGQHTYSSYNVNMKRDSDGNNYVSVSFGDEDEEAGDAGFSIAFFKKCMIVVLYQFGQRVGELEFGDYDWSDEL